MLAFAKQRWPIKYNKQPLMVLVNSLAEMLKHWARTAAVARLLTTTQIEFACDVAASFAQRFASRRLTSAMNSCRSTLIMAAVYANLGYGSVFIFIYSSMFKRLM